MRTAWLAALAALFIPVAVAAQSAAPEGGAGDDLPPMMRDPRQLSGIPRGEQTDPAGQLTVRAVQGAMKRTEFGEIRGDFPAGALIHLVGIDASGKLSVRSIPLDGEGRAVFDRLATNGSQAYFVLAVFPRKGAEDRLASRVVNMPPQVGVRMMLAGEAVDSGKPPIDDLPTEGLAMAMPGPGTVDIQVRGNDTADVQELELVQAGVDAPVARAKVEVVSVAEAPPAGQMKPPEEDRALRPGLLEVLIARRGEGIAGVRVEILDEATASLGVAESDASGRAVFEKLPAGKKVTARAVVQGKPFQSAAFDPPTGTGQRVRLDVDWREAKALQARFTGVPTGADKVYAARVVGASRPLLTMPFQLTASAGAATMLVSAQPILLSFHGGAQLDDERLFFEFEFQVYNTSVAPYRPGREGLRIPLAKGYTSAGVDGDAAAFVKVDEDRGLVWRSPLPPGVHRFNARFALPSLDGKVSLEMPAPLGFWSAQFFMERLPGVRIDPPAGIQGRSGKGQDGKTYVSYANIQVERGETLNMRFSGLPQHPAWQGHLRNVVGFLVLGLIGWGVWGVAIRGRRGGGRRSILEAEREELLQEVVQLEADLRHQHIAEPAYQRRRGELMRQLETVYAELGPDRRPDPPG